MVLPPSMAKQVVIRNETGHTIHVVGVFGSDEQASEGNNFIRDSASVSPNSSVTLGEHEFNMGTWTAVAPLHSVIADHPTANHQAQFQPTVSGIVTAVHVTIRENSGRLSLNQTHTVE